jgi:Concanavalin A-like lectin/glucanases superfamily
VTIAPPANGAQYRASVLASSPATFWPMSEASGAPHDIVQGLTGIVVPPLAYNQPDPWGGVSAFGFDGISSYFYETTYHPAINAPWSLELWVRSSGPKNPGGAAVMFTQTPTPPLSGGNFSPVIYLSANVGVPIGFAAGSTPNTITGPVSLADNAWHYVAYTFDLAAGGTVSLYVDGALAVALSGIGSPAGVGAADTSVGVAGNTNRGGYWRGSLSSFAFYTRALSAGEVLTHFLGGIAPGKGYPGTGFPGSGFPGSGFPRTLPLNAPVRSDVRYRAIVVAAAPLDYWPLDSRAAVVGPNLQGSATFGGQNIFGQPCASFNGTTDVLVQTGVANPTPPAVLTVECWYQTTGAFPVGAGFVDFEDTQTGASVEHDRELFLLTGELNAFVDPGVSVVATDPATSNDGAWHYAAFTYDGTTLLLYRDGVQVGSAIGAAPLLEYAGWWRIGESSQQASPFAGQLAHCAIYGRALSAQEIADHFAAATTG